MNKKTLVIGASENPERYAYLAINMLRDHEMDVVAIGLKKGEVRGVSFDNELKSFAGVDTVTLYVGPKNQPMYYDYILDTIHPKRIVFNPGTENSEFIQLAQGKGIETEVACTLVLLQTGQY